MKTLHPFPACMFALAMVSAHGGESANYSLTPMTQAAGGRSASFDYTLDGTLCAGAAAASASYQSRGGFSGALFDVKALELSATGSSIEEGGTRLLSAAELLDDQTTIALSSTSISWSVPSGPLTGISSSGLASAGLVYQNSPAVAQGSYAGFTGSLGLTVLDTVSDNFGSYAGDGLGDDWQVQYFGQDNPLAAPLLDPDGDGQNNAFEFTAGLIPTNPLSRFLLSIAPVPGQPGQKNLIFEPVVAGRTYVVKTSPDLSPTSWTTLPGVSVTDNGSQRTVTDTNASQSKKFYRLEIVKP